MQAKTIESGRRVTKEQGGVGLRKGIRSLRGGDVGQPVQHSVGVGEREESGRKIELLGGGRGPQSTRATLGRSMREKGFVRMK